MQLEKFTAEEEADLEELADTHNQQLVLNMSDPMELFTTILNSVEGTKAYEPLLGLLHHLLLIRDEGDNKQKTLQLIDHLVTQVVMDRRGVGQDFEGIHGVSVQALLKRFRTEEELHEVKVDLENAREIILRINREKKELEDQLNLGYDGLIGKLRSQIAQLEELLHYSKTTILDLQQQVKDLQQHYEGKISGVNKQLQDLYVSLQKESDTVAKLLVLRESLVNELEVYKEVVYGSDGESGFNQHNIVLTRAFLASEVQRLSKIRNLSPEEVY